MEYIMTEGTYEKLGVTRSRDAVIFTFEGRKESECAVLLRHKKTGEIMRLVVPEEYCIGSLRSVCIRKLDTRKFDYNYEIDGKIVIDPYAKRINGRRKWFETSRYSNTYQVWCGFTDTGYDWEKDRMPEIAKEDMVMYKLHVRGFTMDAGTGVARGKRGTFAGIQEKLPYLKKLGVTTVELMPAYEFEEMVLPKQQTLPDYVAWKSKKETGEEEPEVISKVNYWGYVPGNYFAPKAAYAAGKNEVTEFKDLVHAMHALSMECVMEIYFNPEMNQNIMIDVLRFWVMEYHVDGFHLIGENLPVKAMAQDILLSRTKLFYTGFPEELLSDRKSYPHLYVYTDEYLYPLRKLLNHKEGTLLEFADQQKKQRPYSGFVNYAAINNSFTLADVFSYCDKHNMANGENNADGLEFNYTDNYGVEGPTRRKYIQFLRRKQIRNAIAMVMLAQGVPLLASGDEFGNSQDGNNNAYCQDNKTGWVNWKKAAQNEKLIRFVRDMMAFRKEHPVIRAAKPMKLSDYLETGFPDLSYHGDAAWLVGFAPGRLYTGMLYGGAYRKKTDGSFDDDIYAAYNFNNGKRFLALPRQKEGKKWYLVMDTDEEEPFVEKEKELTRQDMLEISGMSVKILIGR